MKSEFKTVDEYISSCRDEVRPMLLELRQVILKAAPEAAEKISWGMATFVYLGNLVHFSSEKNHIGFHPAPSAIIEFSEELKRYKTSKGTVQLPYSEPIPGELIGRMVAFRVKEQNELSELKKAGKELGARKPRVRYEMPSDIKSRLLQESLTESYNDRPPYQQNDYIGWIERAKRPQTREKRISQMLLELRAKDSYMGAPYNAKK